MFLIYFNVSIENVYFWKCIEKSIYKCMLEKRLVFKIRNYIFVKNLEYLLGWIHHFYFLFKRNGQQRNPRFYDTNYYFTYSVSDINMTFEILLFYSNTNTSGLDIPFGQKISLLKFYVFAISLLTIPGWQ